MKSIHKKTFDLYLSSRKNIQFSEMDIELGRGTGWGVSRSLVIDRDILERMTTQRMVND